MTQSLEGSPPNFLTKARITAGIIGGCDGAFRAALANVFSFALPMGRWKQSGVGARWGGANPVLSPQLRFALGLMRATAAHGLRRLGITPGAHARRS